MCVWGLVKWKSSLPLKMQPLLQAHWVSPHPYQSPIQLHLTPNNTSKCRINTKLSEKCDVKPNNNLTNHEWKSTSNDMLWETPIHPCFQGLLTITRIHCIRSLSDSTIGLFQYLINLTHASTRQSSCLAISPPIFHICLHFCLALFKCSWHIFLLCQFSTMGWWGTTMQALHG